MCAQRDEGSDNSISIGSIDSSSDEQESFPEVVDSDVITEGRSSDEQELTLQTGASTPSSHASTPPSTAPASDASYSDQQRRQYPSTRRTSRRASSKARVAKRNTCTSTSGRSQLPLREVVARRAFQCTIGVHGELSKMVNVVKKRKDADLEVGEPMTESEDGSDETRGHNRRHSHGQPPTSEFRAEPVPYGSDIYVGHEVGAIFVYLDQHAPYG